MAEAASAVSSSKYFCHKCDTQLEYSLPEFMCPLCTEGFVEVLEEQPSSSDSSDGGPSERTRLHLFEGESDEFSDDEIPDPNSVHYFVRDFISYLGGRAGSAPVTRQGAFSRFRTLDGIVDHILRQMGEIEYPPLSPQTIAALPTIAITEEHVRDNAQCVVCWETFSLNENVKRLPCQHVYHGNCITPWLEIQGTCPICRDNLGLQSASMPSVLPTVPEHDGNHVNPGTSPRSRSMSPGDRTRSHTATPSEEEDEIDVVN